MTVFLLSGCGGLTFAPDFAPLRAFSLSVEATVNGKPFAGELVCASYEEISLTLTAPEELRGLTVSAADSGYRIELDGMTDDLPRDRLPPNAPLRLLFDAVRAAVFTNHGAFAGDRETKTYTAALTVNGQPVTVVFSEDGSLNHLTADRLTAVFQ